jgi:hypothetical protein
MNSYVGQVSDLPVIGLGKRAAGRSEICPT